MKSRHLKILQEIQNGTRPPTKVRSQRVDLGSKRKRSDENDDDMTSKQKKKCTPAQGTVGLAKSAVTVETDSEVEQN